MRKYLGLFIGLGVIALIAIWAMSLFNGMKRADIAIRQQWGQVEVAYQARADKSKNLVEIVKGAANFESQTLKDVVAARAKAIEIKLTGDDLTPEKIREFEQAQANLGGAIGRLLVENYPTLQAVQSFRDFQTQYEGMENRIAVERHKFNEVVADYNVRVETLPGSLFAGLFGFQSKEGFSSQPGTENRPGHLLPVIAATAADFLTPADRQRVAEAISAAERRTSGEIRVHLEDRIEGDVLDHAAFVFEELGMQLTRDRNGVLIYVSVADRKAAVVGDKGINEVVPEGFWNDVFAVLRQHFAAGRPADGLCEAVTMVGEKLVHFHPLRSDDRDELSNEVSIGRP